jgi:hypothetical protein
MDEAVQLAQDVVRDVLRRARLAVQVDRDLRVLEADLTDEVAEVDDRRVDLRPTREFLVVDRQDERRRARLLLRELRQVAVARHPQDFHPFLLDRLRQRADAEPRGVLRAKVLVDDDDGKAKLHPMLLGRLRAAPKKEAGRPDMRKRPSQARIVRPLRRNVRRRVSPAGGSALGADTTMCPGSETAAGRDSF